MAKNKSIYINSTIGSSRAATMEDAHLTDLYIDFPDHKKKNVCTCHDNTFT